MVTRIIEKIPSVIMAASWLALAAAFCYLVSLLITSPVVYWSTTRDECVRVEPEESGSCRDIPEFHTKIPVR